MNLKFIQYQKVFEMMFRKKLAEAAKVKIDHLALEIEHLDHVEKIVIQSIKTLEIVERSPSPLSGYNDSVLIFNNYQVIKC